MFVIIYIKSVGNYDEPVNQLPFFFLISGVEASVKVEMREQSCELNVLCQNFILDKVFSYLPFHLYIFSQYHVKKSWI